MQLSSQMQKKFINEIDFALTNMRSSNVASQKWYYFSAIHGMATRIYNMEYDPELVFIYHVFQLVHNMVNSRINAITTGQDSTVNLSEKLFLLIENELESMLELLKEGKETYPVLQRLVNIAYSTTGNGYYLTIKGLLNL